MSSGPPRSLGLGFVRTADLGMHGPCHWSHLSLVDRQAPVPWARDGSVLYARIVGGGYDLGVSTDQYADQRAAYHATQAELSDGWALDGLRCASTGLARAPRSSQWRAIARGPGGMTVEGHGADPAAALSDLIDRVETS